MGIVMPPEEEQKRIHSRQREQLRRELQRLAAQGRGLLLTQGYREKRGWWKERHWQDLRPQLPDWLSERLEVFRRLLAALDTELDCATSALEAAAPRRPPQGPGGIDL